MSEDVATDLSRMEAEKATAPQVPDVPAEKMLAQSEVDRIVGAAKAKERAQVDAYYRNMMGQQGQSGGMGGMPNPGFDKAQLIEEATAAMQAKIDETRQAAELEAHKKQVDEVARTYLDKMKQGPTLYEDFTDVTKSFKPGKFPAIAIWAAQQDNTAAIIYDLAKNPQKLAQLQLLAVTDEELAVSEMTKLSQSIKRNEEAVNQNVKSPQPLSKLKPSVVAGSDSGKMNVSDLRKQPWLRA
jgi:altronate dehydratase